MTASMERTESGSDGTPFPTWLLDPQRCGQADVVSILQERI